jgi:transposase
MHALDSARRQVEISAWDRIEIRKEKETASHVKVRRWMHILWQYSQGHSLEQVARICDVSVATVRATVDRYRQGGLAALRAYQPHRPVSALLEHGEEIRASLEQTPVATLQEARERIEQLVGQAPRVEAVGAVLHKLGFRRRKVGGVPAKADVEEQEAFEKKKLRPRLEEAQQGARKVVFVDAVHIVFGAWLGWVWSLTRWFVPTGSGRQRSNLLGALDAVTLTLITVCNETTIRKEQVVALLETLAASTSLPITVVLDNARYQHNKLVVETAQRLGLELLFLPPYSPNLNLIERLWKWLKTRIRSARSVGDFVALKRVVDHLLTTGMQQDRQQLSTLLTWNFQSFRNLPLYPKNLVPC